MMEVPDEGWIQDVPGRNPGVLLWTIFLPVHQILIVPPTGLEEAPHGISRSTTNKPGGRWRPGGGLELTLLNRFEARNMECGVDSHGMVEAEADCCKVDDPGDGEGAHKLWDQLPGVHS
eukprot:superscaffoldBa00001715_g11737